MKDDPKIQKKKIGYKKETELYSLIFFLPLESNVTYCIASCIPYTYSYMNSQLEAYQSLYE